MDTFLDGKLEKEQEFKVLLSEQEDSEGERASTNGAESDGAKEDWNEVREDKSSSDVFNEEKTASGDSFETEQVHEEECEGQEESFTDVSDEEEPAVADRVETREELRDVSEVEEQQRSTNISNEEESDEAETVSSLSYP